eukprot:GHUV01030268.1.p3 GENE.GHUV01030268.1~~GHUV01030268.1.p3  ORF type:complete len:103 (+),score=14.92 GHUV01030268.1:1372-1680(+)
MEAAGHGSKGADVSRTSSYTSAEVDTSKAGHEQPIVGNVSVDESSFITSNITLLAVHVQLSSSSAVTPCRARDRSGLGPLVIRQRLIGQAMSQAHMDKCCFA